MSQNEYLIKDLITASIPEKFRKLVAYSCLSFLLFLSFLAIGLAVYFAPSNNYSVDSPVENETHSTNQSIG